MSGRTADIYPAGAIVGLIGGDQLTEPTTRALRERLAPLDPADGPAVLDGRQLAALAAVAARLVPQDERTAGIDLTERFHRRIEGGLGVGWRDAGMPPTPDMHRRALSALNVTAEAFFGLDFAALKSGQQDKLLRTIQAGHLNSDAWRGIDPSIWFREILATLVNIYYAHPLAQDDIGYAGMADASGWPEVGLDARERREPMPVPGAHSKECA